MFGPQWAIYRQQQQPSRSGRRQVTLAPSPYEVAFGSFAYGEDEIAAAIEAVAQAAEELAGTSRRDQ